MDFNLSPPSNATEDSNEDVIAKLRKLIEDGTILFKPLIVKSTWFKTWQGKMTSLSTQKVKSLVYSTAIAFGRGTVTARGECVYEYKSATLHAGN